MLAMISVSAGYGTDGSSTPITVALLLPSSMVLPITDGSLLSDCVQKRLVSTATPAALKPSSDGSIRRPRLAFRSEEHTSELQSRRDLVCRLLLEKKKKKNKYETEKHD